jgi:hypothetical protein
MPTTEASLEQTRGAPIGAIPQTTPTTSNELPVDQTERWSSEARSGDTEVVFRLERDVPMLRRLKQLCADGLDRLIEHRRILVAGVLVTAAVVALASLMGGAYRDRPQRAATTTLDR